MEEVFELLDREDFLEIVDDHDNTLLHNLLNRPNIQTDVVKQLMDRGLDVNATNAFGYTPLHYAVCNPECNGQLVKLLLDRGASIDLKDKYGNSTLHHVLRQSDLAIIKLMIDRGADVNLMNNDGDTPLNHAVSHSKWSVLNLIPNIQDDVSEGGMAGKLEVLKMLLDYEPDINLKNNYGDSPLHCAVSNCKNKRDLIRLLLYRDADCNLINHSGDSALLCAIRNDDVDTEVVQMLLDFGADVNCKNNNADFPLITAVKNPSCFLSMVKLLLDQGANVLSCDKNGETSLQKAITEYENNANAEPTVKLLLKYTLLKSLGFNISRLIKGKKNYKVLMNYVTECSLEIFRMGSEYVGRNNLPNIDDQHQLIFSMYEFMRGFRTVSHDAMQLFRGVNTHFDHLLRILHSKRFPIFNEVMSAKIKRTDMLQKLKEQFFFVFQNGRADCMIFLDYYSACEVAEYLSNEDLLNWILAFYGCSKNVCAVQYSLTARELLGKRMLEESEAAYPRFKMFKPDIAKKKKALPPSK